MLKRILEPEVMDTADEAIDYNSMDHSTVNRLFVDDFLSALPSGVCGSNRPMQVFDAGTGTALIPLELLGRGIDAVVTASDLAEQMLIVARANVSAAGQDLKIRLVRSDCKSLLDSDASYDAVMSNSIIHHIPNPGEVMHELWRILKPGGLLFIRDLMRPETEDDLNRLVKTYAGTANAHQQQMFRDSLHAALDLTEVRQLLFQTGIPPESAQPTSDRHWTIRVIGRNRR